MADTWATDLLDEDGGDQSMRNGFEAELRTLLAATWEEREGDVAHRPGRLRWPMIAAAVLAVVGVSAALVLRLNRTPSHVSLQPPAVTEPAATTSIPTSSVPAAAVGPRWVVTTVAGLALTQSDLPWFKVASDGAVDGYDGCNWYSIRPGAEGIESTAAACMPGIVPHIVTGPVSAEASVEIRSGDVVAEPFTNNSGARAPELIGEWQTPSGATKVRFTDKGVDINGCANVRTWALSESLTVSAGDFNQLSGCLTAEGHQADARFVEQLAGGHADLSFRKDGSLWVATEEFITRLVKRSETPADSIEAKVVVDAATPVLTGRRSTAPPSPTRIRGTEPSHRQVECS